MVRPSPTRLQSTTRLRGTVLRSRNPRRMQATRAPATLWSLRVRSSSKREHNAGGAMSPAGTLLVGSTVLVAWLDGGLTACIVATALGGGTYVMTRRVMN